MSEEIADRIAAIRDPAPAPEAPAPEAPVAEQMPAEAPVEAQEPSPAPEAADPAEEMSTIVDTAQEMDAEAIEVESLDDLADHFGVDKADLYNLKVPVTMADGSRQEVSLGEWKDGYRASQEAAQEAQRAAQSRQRYEQQRQEMAQAWMQKVREADNTLTLAEQQVVGEFQQIDWNALREHDPAEWAARRQNFQERMHTLEQSKRELGARWQQQQEQFAQEQQQQVAEVLEAERQHLLRSLPEWQNEDTAKAERSALSDYLKSSGFNHDEVSSVADHRLVLMARKAMLYDKEMAGVSAAKKRVVKIGKKTVSPGTTRGKQTARTDRNAVLQKALKKSGKVEDAAALIRARLTG
jgi:hypothetical protein